jgi:tetratricopeptide (TPR) repeat protein
LWQRSPSAGGLFSNNGVPPRPLHDFLRAALDSTASPQERKKAAEKALKICDSILPSAHAYRGALLNGSTALRVLGKFDKASDRLAQVEAIVRAQGAPYGTIESWPTELAKRLADIQTQKGNLLAEQGKAQEADKLFHEAWDTDPDDYARLKILHRAALERGDLREAAIWYAAMERRPEHTGSVQS